VRYHDSKVKDDIHKRCDTFDILVETSGESNFGEEISSMGKPIGELI
jgi:hypothetical protein